MTNPVPGYPVSTPYRATGSHWASCGWHTGVDIAAPYGTQIVAARSGTVSHVDYGSAFGGHQFVVRPGDGTEDFYAHCGSRPAHGAVVSAGQGVAIVDAEGNATGPHLHFETHSGYGWSCGLMTDPMPVISDAPGPSGQYPRPSSGKVYLSKLRYGQQSSDSVWYLQDTLNRHSLPAPGNVTLPLTANYFDQTSTVVVTCQKTHGYGNDPIDASYVGRNQAHHLFDGTGLTVVDDI